MIRQFDEPGNADAPSPRALLQSIERHLSKTGRVTDKKAHEAQQLVYDAWEAPREEQEQVLIRRALEIDPSNVDALLHAAVYAGVDGEEEIELLRMVVAIGEKNLGPKAFKELAGAFWGSIETRPYMRARMLGSLLALNRLAEARELFEKYHGELEFNALFAWGRVLERFLSEDLPGAATALAAARKQNPHMQVYVKGHRQLPRELPEAYAPGSKEEAVCFAESVRAAWVKYPAALKWLKAQKVK